MRKVLALLPLVLLGLASAVVAAAPPWDVDVDAVRPALTKVTVDRYKGADSVVVLDQRWVDVEDSGLSRTVQRTVVKALTASGAREQSVALLPYDPLSADVQLLRARVFTAGAVREVPAALLQDHPDPLATILWNSRHRLLPLGRLAAGDAVELVTRRVGFTYALLDAESVDETRFVPPMKGHFYDIVPFWASSPVVEQSYSVTISPDKHLQYEFFNGSARIADRLVAGKRVVSFTTRDFVPIEREQGMVAWSDVAPKLLLTTSPGWEAKSVWFFKTQEDFGSFAATPALRTMAERITAGLTSDEEKATALTHWVAENIRYIGLHMGAGEGYTLHPAAMTLRDRGGVCKDKAGILVALLRAAGLEAYAGMTMAGERIDDLAADQFNHCITVWRKQDRTTALLDPTWVPGVRELWSSREQQQEVLMGLPEGADLLTTPVSPAEAHPLTVAVRSELTTSGDLKGVMTVTADGQSDAGLRRLYRGRPRTEWSTLDESFMTAVDRRAVIGKVTRSAPDDIWTPFALEISFRVPGYARVLADGRLLLTPLAARHPVGQATHAEELSLALEPAQRKQPVRIGCSKLVRLSERMTLPAGATVEGLPESVSLDGSGKFVASWKVGSGSLSVDEALSLTRRIFTPEEWPALRDALDALRKLSETRIVVTLASGKEKA